MSKNILGGRKEVLFLWDGENFNPNGDLLNGNEPRMDDDTGLAEVSDVRIKRTIRDHIHRLNLGEVFVRERTVPQEGVYAVLDAKETCKVENVKIDPKNIETTHQSFIDRFIDIRAFGCVVALPKGSKGDSEEKGDDKKGGTKSKDGSVSFTGPVQFRVSKSLHEVDKKDIEGSCVFSSDYNDGTDKKKKVFKETGTIRSESILKYAMLATYGVMDHHSAKHTNFTNEDAEIVLNSLWFGTKNLNTRSKNGQIPRFMLVITYKDDFFIGDLNNSLDIKNKLADESSIRSINDFSVDFTRLKEKLEKYKEHIEKVEYMVEFDFEKIHQSQFDNKWVNISKV